ncbi:hypothetical protein [Nocardioides sediminis]|uniref:hypothetical protein n=1 Tax=Nocardioides sediminis TaxID=433648 RepID=UPI000D30C468|nr:hypothetical protein [Nocardioides sediminis]
MFTGPVSPARLTVWVAAVAAVVARYPSAMWPLRPDEAGFLLVARTWRPAPDSVYGTYFVDRPPEVIALVRLTDWLGGPYALRVLATVGIFTLVLLSAATARRLASYAAGLSPDRTDRVAAWTAVATAALVSNTGFDAVTAKGEHLGIPLVMGSCWLALAALERTSVRLALAAGLVAMLAVGLKQSLVGGLVFGAVLLGAAALADRGQQRTTHLRLAAGAAAGAAVPVVATVVWAVVAGVDLGTLWYTVVGFRSDAAAVLAAQPSEALERRAFEMWLLATEGGVTFLVAWFVLHLPPLLRRMPVATSAVAAMLLVDLLALVQSGSWWKTYLVALVPSVALATCLLLTVERPSSQVSWRRAVASVTRALVVLSVVTSTVSLYVWWHITGEDHRPVGYYTGEAIGRAARPGDTLVVYGGRPDIQWASGLRSPYEHLWSLPMRTLDPGLTDLRELLTGPRAPTWFVEFTVLDTWSESGTERIGEELLERYEYVATLCGEYRVYHLRTLEDPVIESRCGEPWRGGLASLRD